MNCLSCIKNSGLILLENGNCINKCVNDQYITPIGECVITCPNGTYQFSLNNSCLNSCHYNYEFNNNNECIIQLFDKNISADEFKNQITNNITSYVNSSNVINGFNFIAVVLS